MIMGLSYPSAAMAVRHLSMRYCHRVVDDVTFERGFHVASDEGSTQHPDPRGGPS